MDTPRHEERSPTDHATGRAKAREGAQGGDGGHGSGDPGGLVDQLRQSAWHVLTGHGSDNAISDARRQHIGPLRDRLIADAKLVCRCSRTAQKGKCVRLFHALLNHSSSAFATMVPGRMTTLCAMPAIDYQQRLDAAMERAGVGTQELADALGVTYQAIRKVQAGASKALTAENNVAAAQFLGVSSEWLATGKGPMRAALVREDAEIALLSAFRRLSDQDRQQVLGYVNGYAARSELGGGGASQDKLTPQQKAAA